MRVAKTTVTTKSMITTLENDAKAEKYGPKK
jgi:hypothetical protein